ncbi:MAG: hypothetical protein ACJ75J_00355 [Cytophagaceae bacterium]
MKIFRAMLILPLLLSFCGPGKTIKWKRLKTEQEVRAAIDAEVPQNSGIPVLEDFAQKQNLSWSVLQDTIMYCKSPEKTSGFLVSSCWLMTFHFADKKLTRYEVKKGFTGP